VAVDDGPSLLTALVILDGTFFVAVSLAI